MASDALSYIVQGLAQGAPQGFRLGLLAQEGQQRQQQIDAAKKAAVIEAETKELKTAAEAGTKGLIAYCIAHPAGAVAIILALCVLAVTIGFAFSGYEKKADGTITKSAIEVRK